MSEQDGLESAAPARPEAAPSVEGGVPALRLDRAIDADGLIDETGFKELEAELVDAGRWADLATLYDIGIQHAPDGEVGRGMMLHASLLAMEQLGDAARAERYLRRVLASDPERADALDVYRLLCLAQERWSEAADLLDQAIAVSPDDQKPELCLELARVAADRLGDPERAVAALLFAHELDPTRLPVLQAAREVFVGAGRFGEARAVLDAEAMVRFGEPGAPEAPTEESRALGEAYRRLGVRVLETPLDHALAQACLERARVLGDKEALAHLDELAATRQDWEAAARATIAKAAAARDKHEAARLYVRVAELHLAFGDDVLKSDDFVQRALILSPGAGAAVGYLERAHARLGRGSAALAERLEAVVRDVRDPGVRVRILTRIAALRAAADGAESEEARRAAEIEAHRRVLEAAPDHRVSTEALSELLALDGEHAARAELLEAHLAVAPGRRARIATRLSLGAIHAEWLGDSDRAQQHFEAVLAEEPGNFQAASALRALYTDAGRTAELLGVLRVLVDYSPDLFSRLDLLHETAKVAAEVSEDDAFAALRAIFELDPNSKESQAKLTELARGLNRDAELAASLAAAGSRLPGARGAELFVEAGRLFDERLHRPADAIRSYKRALELDAELGVRDRLEALLAERDDPRAAIDMLESQLARGVEPEEQVRILAKLGNILEAEVGDLDAAAEAYRRLLAVGRDDAEALALGNLEPLCERRADWDGLVDVLARREAKATSPHERAKLAARRARALHRGLGRGAEAAEAYLGALAALDDDAQVVSELHALLGDGVARAEIAAALDPIYGARAQHARQLEVLEARVETASTPADRAALALRAASLLDDRLGEPERALGHLMAALAARPDDETALDRLVALARRTGAESTAAAAIEDVLGGAAAGEATGRLAAALGGLRDGLGDAEASIELYRRALEAQPGNEEAAAALERLLGDAGRWSELAALVDERRAATDDPVARSQLGLRLAALRQDRLDDLEGAAAACRDVLEVDPGSTAALNRLADVLEQSGDHEALLEALDRARAATTDAALVAALDVRAGDTLRLELGRPEESLLRYRRALGVRERDPGALRGVEALLELDSTRAAAGAALEPLYAAEGRHRERVVALEAQLSGAEHAPDRAELLRTIAAVQHDDLDLDADSFWTLARGFREGLFGSAERPDLVRFGLAANLGKDLVALLEACVSKSPEDAELRRDLARLYDGPVAEPGKAAAAWKSLSELVEGDEEALAALERLTGAGDDPAALAQVLMARGEAAAEDAERVALYKRASAIWEELVEDLEQAALAMEQALAVSPRDRNTLDELERLYDKLERPERVAEILALQAEAVDEPAARADVLAKLGRVAGELQRADDAVDAYLDVLAIDPAHAEARQGLEALLDGPAGTRAALGLEPVYRARADWTRLVEVYERLLDASDDAADRVERLNAIRSIQEERLRDLEKAFSASARAFKEAPERPDVLEALQRLARSTSAEDELVGLLEDQADAYEAGSGARYAMRIRIARLLDAGPGQVPKDPTTALAAWRRVLDDWPQDLDALEAVVRLGSEVGDEVAVASALETLAQVHAEPELKAEHLRTAARIIEGREDSRRKAISIYEQVLELMPDDREALGRLDNLYAAAGEHAKLERTLEALVRLSAPGKDRAVYELRLGRLRFTALQAPWKAVDAFARVLERRGEGSEPALEGALDSLEQLVQKIKAEDRQLAARAAGLLEPIYAERGEHLQVISAKETQAAAIEDDEERRAVLLSIASTYERELEQPDMAFLTVARAFSLAPEDRGLQAELERLTTLTEGWEELAEIYAEALPRLEDQSAMLELSRRTAWLFDEKLGLGVEAVEHYERVLSVAPHDADVLAALLRIHRASGDAGGQVRALRRQLALPDSDEAGRMAIWSEIGRILESEIGDVDAALEAYGARVAMDPSDRATVSRMAELAEKERRGPVAVESLERLAALTSAPADRANVLVRLGVARRDLDDDALHAVDAFAEALVAVPDHPGAVGHLAGLARDPGPPRARAAAVLAPLYLRSGAFTDYVACREAQLAASEAAEERKGLLVDIAQIYERRLGRPELAFAYSCRALHEDPRDGEVRAHVERLASEHGLAEDLAGFYLDEVDQVRDAPLALMMRRRVAELYDDALGDPERAIAQYMKILEVAPGDQEALRALERLYRASGSFGELAEVFRRRIAQSEEPRVRAVLMRELARIQANELEDAAGAIATLRRLLEIEPNDVDAMHRLADLCAYARRFSELADVLDQIVHASEPGGAAALEARLRLAKLKLEELGDPSGALDLLRALLQLDPSHEASRDYVRGHLEEALAEDDGALALQLARILAEALQRTEEWQALIEILRIEVDLVADPYSRVGLHEQIAGLYRDRLGQPELAFATLTRAFRDAPTIADVRDEMERLAIQLLMIEDLVEVYEASLSAIPDPEARLGVEVRIAELLESQVGDRERAVEAWDRVLSRRPMDVAATEALDRLLTALGRWAALPDVLEKRLELAGDDKAAAHALAMRLGQTWEERLAEPGEALAAYRQAYAFDRTDPETLRALARLLDEEADADELYDALSYLSNSTDDPRQLLRVLPRLGNLASDRFGRHSEAIAHWERVVQIEPGHRAAHRALEALYEREGRWQTLADHLERQLSGSVDESESIRLQRKLGLIKGTRLGDVDDAVRVWTGILKRNPNDVEALEALRKTYRAAERWEDVVATVRKLVPLQADSDGVKRLRFELAEIFLTNLGRREEAIDSAKRVLDVEPLTVAELMRLEEIFVAAGAYHDAVRVMNRRAETTDDAGAKADILFQIASIYETKLNRRANAASAYERILAQDASNAKAYDALAGIYESSGDYRRLVELHNRRLGELEGSEERRRLLFAVIEIQEKRLGHKDLGFMAACRAFAEEGADPEAQAIAERLAEETNTWEILTEVFEEQIEQVPLPRAIELRRRLAQIYLRKIDEPVQAERHLDLVLSIRPEDQAAREQLAGLLEGQERWRDLVSLLVDRVDFAEDPAEQKTLLMRAAEIEHTRLHETDAAISTLRRVLTVDASDDPALERLAELLRETEQWNPLIEVLERRALTATTDEERAERRLDVATVWDECIDDPRRAVAAYRSVLDLDPTQVRALKALEHLYAEAERWDDLVDVYEQQSKLAGDPELEIELLSRIAEVQEQHFEDLKAAADTLVRALHVDPAHLPTVKSLERVWAADGQWSRLAEAYRRHIDVTEDLDEQLELQLELATVEMNKLGDLDAAEAAYKAALELEPRSRDAVRGLAELHEKRGSWFNALEMFQREAELLGRSPAAVDAWHRAARIHRQMLMDEGSARKALERGLQIDPGHVPTLQELAELYRSDGQWADVLRLEAQRAQHASDSEERALGYQRAAEIALDRLDDLDAATRLFEHALDAVPDHVPSAKALSDLYFVAEEWERAERLFEMLVAKLDHEEERDEVCRQYYRLAYISEKLADDERALKRYLASYEVDSTYLPTLEGLAGALLRLERWEDAQRIFQTILIHHRESLTDAEVVDLYHQLGELAVRLGDAERGRRAFDSALELDANHPGSLRSYAELCEQTEQWEEAYDHRARLIDQLRGQERLDELLRQARLCELRLKDAYRAIDAYAEARRVRPDDESVLAALGRLFRQTGQHPQAIDALTDLARILDGEEARRDVLIEIGDIHAGDRDDWSRAADAYNAALDLDPDSVPAFAALEAMLARKRRWAVLEENYRRMIERLSARKNSRPKLVALWKTLGDLHREVLKSDDQARTAYEVVLKLEPNDHATAQTLANLLSQKRETVDEALKIFHGLVPVVNDPVAPVRSLSQLYAALERYDQTMGALGALMLMRAARDDESRAYQALLKRQPAGPTRQMTDKLWRSLVFHPDCRTSLADVLSVLYRGAPALFGEGQAGLMLKKKEHVDLGSRRSQRAGLRYFSVWNDLARVMQVGPMEHYHRAGDSTPPRLFPGETPVLFAGEQHEIFRDLPTRQLVWTMARQMACARPELAPARALMPEEVAAAIEAAIRLYVPKGSGVDLQIDARLVQEWMRALQKNLSEKAIKALRAPVQICWERGDLRKLTSFLEGVEHTACRAALLMAGDVRVAERGLADPDWVVEMNPRRRARHVMFFLLSDEYFTLRRQLGMDIPVPNQAGRSAGA